MVSNLLGDPVALQGSPIEYEMRAAWGCAHCHAVLVGTKNGILYLVRGRAVEFVKVLANVSLRSIYGCLNEACDWYNKNPAKYRAVVGDYNGNVHVFRDRKTEPSIIHVAASVGPREDVTTVRLLQDASGEPRCLAVTDLPALRFLHPASAASGDPHDLRRTMRSIIALSGPQSGQDLRDPSRERRWLLISTDGHVSGARVSWKGSSPSDSVNRADVTRFEMGRLQFPPLWVTADRYIGTVRSILYGSEHGLHAAMLDSNGIRSERPLLTGTPVQYIRIVNIFDIDHLLACSPGGVIWTMRWEHPDDTVPDAWFKWPALQSDVMFAEVDAPASPDAFEVDATLILRTHEVTRIPIFNRIKIRKRLRDELTFRQGTFPDTSDKWRYAEITTSPEKVDFQRLCVLWYGTGASGPSKRRCSGWRSILARRNRRHSM